MGILGRTGLTAAGPQRHRLPNRRRGVTETVLAGNTAVEATIGFTIDDEPAEIFLTGQKTGSGMSFILQDAAVIINIALQYGISARVLAKSIARIPETVDGPAVKAASAIGAALDLIARCELHGASDE